MLEFQEILIQWTLPSDMFWSEAGRDVRVPVDPHTVDFTFRHVLVSAR